MKLILSTLFIFFIAVNSHALDIYKSKSVFKKSYDNSTIPLDMIFTDEQNFMIYDALSGKLLDYEKGELKSENARKTLIDGNCFVKINNDFFFCDSRHSRILKLDKNFNTVTEMKTDGKFDPTDIVLQKGRYVAVDNDNNRLALFKRNNNKLLGYIGRGCGEEKSCLYYPFSLVQNNAGYLFVSEVMNTRVQVFTDKLKAVSFIGEWGVDAGKLYRPKGIGLINDKYLIISDGYIGVLQIFNTEGKFIGVVGDENGEIKRYQSPTRIRVYKNFIGVVDPFERVVDVIELGELK